MSTADESAFKPSTHKDLLMMKRNKIPLSWITAYDFPSAYCAEISGIDMILIGDSGAMVQYGLDRTSGIDMNLMIEMSKAVRRGALKTLLVGDMPRGSYEISDEMAVSNALRFMIEGECDLVKLEGISNSTGKRIKLITEAGIPVIGHLGLTPQSLGRIEKYKVAGKEVDEILQLKRDISMLQDCGAVAVLLEAIPPNLMEKLSKISDIPIYGIGCGIKSDGQLLIYHDVVGYYPKFRPKFAKNFAAEVLRNFNSNNSKTELLGLNFLQDGIGEISVRSIIEYVRQVKSFEFPTTEYCYADLDQELVNNQFK